MKIKIVTPGNQAQSFIKAGIEAGNIQFDSKLHYFGPSTCLSIAACFHAFYLFSPIAGFAVNYWRRIIDSKPVWILSDGLTNRSMNVSLN